MDAGADVVGSRSSGAVRESTRKSIRKSATDGFMAYASAPPALPAGGAAEAPPAAASPALLLGLAPVGARERPAARVRVHVCTHAACASQGADAVLADVEELGSHCGVAATSHICMNLCGQGPNCEIEDLAAGGSGPKSIGRLTGREIVKAVGTFDATLRLLRKALGVNDLGLPPEVVKRQRPRSDALRLLGRDMARPSEEVVIDMLEVEDLMTTIIDLELAAKGSAAPDPERVASLREAQMMRGRARGRCALSDPDLRPEYAARALDDFEVVRTAHPLFAPAFFEAGRVHSFVGRLQEALDAYRRALTLSTSATEASAQKGFRLRNDEVKQLQRAIEKLEARIASGVGEEDDSGPFDGSGRWPVEAITGVSWDTCIYHLRTRAPSDPHPFPHDAWHVACRFGGSPAREYTPMSTAEDWEAGRLDLLVKTYVDGVVSSEFGKLITVENARQESQVSYTPMEDQPCWVWVGKPVITLYLPSCLEMAPPDDARSSASVVDKVAIVVGGTGVAPALQLLREVADPNGAFGGKCEGALLCSSHTILDVLCLDELREIERSAPDRIKVWHTLTAAPRPKEGDEEESEEDPWENVPQLKLQGKHASFATYYSPFEPKEGYVGKAEGEREPFRRRVDEAMLREVLPPAGPTTRVVTCGPPGMQEAVKSIVFKLGHSPEALIELAGTIGQTSRPTLADEVQDVELGDEWPKPRAAAPKDRGAANSGGASARAAMNKDASVEPAAPAKASVTTLKLPCLQC